MDGRLRREMGGSKRARFAGITKPFYNIINVLEIIASVFGFHLVGKQRHHQLPDLNHQVCRIFRN
jgi:hypothetical protein